MSTRSFTELAEGLYERSPESRARVAEKVARLTEELGLADLRSRMEQTQADVAKAIGTSQSGVSRLERQQDLLVSTLRDYIAATGGQLRLVAEYPDYDLEIRLPVLERPRWEPRSFRIVWQNVQTRQFVHVGELTYTGKRFRFRYTADAELHADFFAFPAFPDLRETYESDDLFDFFADRILSTAQNGFVDLLDALGLTREEATPMELLARSWGLSPHDTMQVIPEPTRGVDESEVLHFLASGVRHVDEGDPERVGRLIARLHVGQPLELEDEPSNRFNEDAIVLLADGKRVGWVPDYLLDYVHKHRGAGAQVHVAVEHANGSERPWHLRLLCRMTVFPQ